MASPSSQSPAVGVSSRALRKNEKTTKGTRKRTAGKAKRKAATSNERGDGLSDEVLRQAPSDASAMAALDASRPLDLPTHHDRPRVTADPDGHPRHVRVLVIDVGGTNVKVLATGKTARRATPSGPTLTPEKMVKAVRALTQDWAYDVVSLGYPGPVVRGRIAANPVHLGTGWVGYDFEKAFGCPVKILNDAALQALGSYQGGDMLFLGLGTGLGSALIAQGHLHPLELAHLPYRKGKTFEEFVGKRGLKKLGKKAWRKAVVDVATRLMAALQADELVLGGGNAVLLKALPPRTRLGENANAFKGGFRLWGPPAPKETASPPGARRKPPADARRAP
jgi:hypothetical protein